MLINPNFIFILIPKNLKDVVSKQFFSLIFEQIFEKYQLGFITSVWQIKYDTVLNKILYNN